MNARILIEAESAKDFLKRNGPVVNKRMYFRVMMYRPSAIAYVRVFKSTLDALDGDTPGTKLKKELGAFLGGPWRYPAGETYYVTREVDKATYDRAQSINCTLVDLG